MSQQPNKQCLLQCSPNISAATSEEEGVSNSNYLLGRNEQYQPPNSVSSTEDQDSILDTAATSVIIRTTPEAVVRTPLSEENATSRKENDNSFFHSEATVISTSSSFSLQDKQEGRKHEPCNPLSAGNDLPTNPAINEERVGILIPAKEREVVMHLLIRQPSSFSHSETSERNTLKRINLASDTSIDRGDISLLPVPTNGTENDVKLIWVPSRDGGGIDVNDVPQEPFPSYIPTLTSASNSTDYSISIFNPPSTSSPIIIQNSRDSNKDGQLYHDTFFTTLFFTHLCVMFLLAYQHGTTIFHLDGDSNSDGKYLRVVLNPWGCLKVFSICLVFGIIMCGNALFFFHRFSGAILIIYMSGMIGAGFFFIIYGISSEMNLCIIVGVVLTAYSILFYKMIEDRVSTITSQVALGIHVSMSNTKLYALALLMVLLFMVWTAWWSLVLVGILNVEMECMDGVCEKGPRTWVVILLIMSWFWTVGVLKVRG